MFASVPENVLLRPVLLLLPAPLPLSEYGKYMEQLGCESRGD
jgi:hypothetical protein